MSLIDRILWVAPQIVVLLLVANMARFRLIRHYPLFFFYVCLQLVRFVVLYSIFLDVRHHKLLYFYTYWAFESLDVVVTIAIIRDIYLALFQPYPALRRAGAAIFHWALAVVILVSGTAATVAQGPERTRLIAGILTFDQSASLVRIGLVLLLVVLGLLFRLRWPHYAFGVLAGFGIYFVIDAAATALRRHFGMQAGEMDSLISAAGFNLGSMIWAWYFLFQRSAATDQIMYSRADLERWNAELAGLM